ncbi:DUF2946 family protein [Methyloligella sp. 2.7D]|uniref:DUF2946 family protein n=1 Tax=unclassified Methyloligella TaxID=2625955 RepID=UPI00157DDF83|nr:DUF2946 family protein [Methyloligella sp. GL2]QKP78136.1 hypothetical protein HT051_12185 [Methyloligella sp. GL2]
MAGALGLLGVLFYAALIPGHLVSQTVTALVQSELGSVVICHSDGSQDSDRQKADHGCPFCHGHAGFQLAALGAGLAFQLPPVPPRVFLPASDEIGAGHRSITPQSRGPPHISA